MVEASPPNAASPSASLQNTTSAAVGSGQPQPKIEFYSAAIGSRENARTKDYFAEQNQKTLTKKQAHSTRIRWLLILSCGLVGVVLLVLAVWWLVGMLGRTEETETTNFWQTEESKEIQNTAQEIYKGDNPEAEGGNDSEVEEYFDKQLDGAQGQKRADIVLSEMVFYSSNARPDLMLKAADEIPNPEDLGESDLRTYCGYVFNAVQSTGQREELWEKCKGLLDKLPVIITDGAG